MKHTLFHYTFFDVIIHVPTVWCLLARQLSQDVLADAGFVCDKAAVLQGNIKGTPVEFFCQSYMECE